jgi:hypothetical protein
VKLGCGKVDIHNRKLSGKFLEGSLWLSGRPDLLGLEIMVPSCKDDCVRRGVLLIKMTIVGIEMEKVFAQDLSVGAWYDLDRFRKFVCHSDCCVIPAFGLEDKGVEWDRLEKQSLFTDS